MKLVFINTLLQCMYPPLLNFFFNFFSLQTYRSAAELVTRNLEGDKRVHITPKNIRVYNSLSNMLREHGNDLAGALHYARKAVEWEPDWANTHNTLANALLAIEGYKEAKV